MSILQNNFVGFDTYRFLRIKNIHNMSPEKYLLSFIGASLSLSESIKIAEVYLQLRDWNAVEKKVKSENLIQARTKSSIQRVYQELWPRLSLLSIEQMELLVDGNNQEQKQLLWYAICQRYAYIREFAVEVVYEKYLSLDYELTDFDYDAFFNRKADWHPELDQIKDTTRKKVKTRIFWLLREVEILSDENMILPITLSRRVLSTFNSNAHDNLRIFPLIISS